ncbi:hypothetical protein D3C75_966670 [compost metagenome]
MVREPGEQDSGRDVADDLAGQNGGNQCAFIHNAGEKFPDLPDLPDIARTDEEKDEGSQQTVVRLAEQIPGKQQHGRQDKRQDNAIVDQMQNRQQA